MDETATRYYHPPERHADDIQRMAVWLTAFFVTLAILAAMAVYFADRLVHHLPFSAEQRFVRPYEAMARYLQDEPDSPEALRAQQIESYLQSLADDLAYHMQMPEDYVVQVHYLDHDTINAFATLGGHIFVFRGLLQELPNENSLAMVMAHEVAHIKHRDPAAALGRGLALQMLYSYVSGDYSRDLVLQSGELGMLMFSREQENEADKVAIHALHQQYGHVKGFDTLFLRFQERDATQQSTATENADTDTMDEWLSSHPALADRVERLRSQATRQHWPLEGDMVLMPSDVRMLLNEERP